MLKFFIVLLLIIFPRLIFAQQSTEKLRVNHSDGFYFTSDFSATFNEGNSNYTEIKTNGRLDYENGKYSSFLFLEQEYKKSPSSLIASDGFIHFRNTYNITEILAAEIFVQNEFDRLSYLDYRTLAGGGLRFDIFNGIYNEDSTMYFRLYLGLGAMYEIENYTIETGLFYYKWRETSYLSLKWAYNNTEFTCVGYFQPYFGDISDFRTLVDTRLNFKIFNNLSFFTGLIYKHNNMPPPTVVNYDISLNSGITINFSF